MLAWMEKNKQATSVPRIRKKFFELGKGRMSGLEYNKMKEYANQLIDDKITHSNGKTEFIVPGWLTGSWWNGTPLQILYDKVFVNDNKTCALWYGILMYEIMIERPELWYATKTVFNGRDFEQAVYWHNE